MLYGLRLGEVLGLDWKDVDLDDGKIAIRRQLQRIRGQTFLAPVKTHAGQRALPLLDLVRMAFKHQSDRQGSTPTLVSKARREALTKLHDLFD